MKERIEEMIVSLDGCWYDIVGSAECFMTYQEKYSYCKQILK
jgi:hypothetical protein